MTFDSILDRLESRRFRIGAVVVLIVLAVFWTRRREALEPRIARVCASLYRHARTAADTIGVDTSRTMLRTWNDQIVIPATTCADLRRTGLVK